MFDLGEETMFDIRAIDLTDDGVRDIGGWNCGTKCGFKCTASGGEGYGAGKYVCNGTVLDGVLP